MIIGDDTLSGGKCSLDGVSVEDIYKRPEKLFGIVGYCPQNNCIEDFLTVRQTLTYLCGLLGVKVETVTNVVRDTMHRFELTEFADTKAEFLSGGNKRKLCCAMAMLGNPKVIFVDEASTGVDPVSRRVMWKGMRYESTNSALILTTHTLEEAEALASKIGIMVAGQFKCFGSL
jgi:ATP-binding cassette subfamily A (ABC1) protein 3